MNAQCRKVLQDVENNKKRRKRSSGISRVEPSGTRKAQQQQSRFRSLREDELQGPPSRTRASLKRRHYESSSTKLQVEKKQNQEDQTNGETDAIIEEPSGAPAIAQSLPDKQTLELIIDTLQRVRRPVENHENCINTCTFCFNTYIPTYTGLFLTPNISTKQKDVYEIFAEPVDPEEVEDYYEIIEEPMDFGTMRAKLHEGLYTSLEQFEHDVFLISGNAMHFNSSGTIFFRQAHGIHKLSKRVFHVLKTNPENFESEFSGSRRRSCRNGFNGKLFLKPSEKTRGNGDNKRCDPTEVDRRSTYKPDLNLNNENWSKSLIHLNQHEHNYTQSLMQFVKDLGPTAQMVAKRKLQSLIEYHQTPNHNSGKEPQTPIHQLQFNSPHSASNNGIMKTYGLATMNPISRELDLRSFNGIDRDESNRDRMVLSCSGGRMDSVVTSTSLPKWIQQEPCESRIGLNLGFLKSKLGKMNEGREYEESSCSSNKLFDPKDLKLQL